MDNLLALLTLFGSIIALGFVVSRANKVLRFPQGNETMKKISASIHKGAMAYLRRQYKILIGFFAIMFVILFVMAALDLLTWFVPWFLLRSVGIRGYADRDESQRPDSGGMSEKPEQRIECSIFGRIGHGIHRSRTGTFGHFHLVPAAETGI